METIIECVLKQLAILDACRLLTRLLHQNEGSYREAAHRQPRCDSSGLDHEGNTVLT